MTEAPMERPKIGDKVKFWEEQDRINRELIPRVLKQHELLTAHVEHHHIDPEARAQIRALEKSAAAEIHSAKRQSLIVSIASLAVAVVALGLSLT